MLRSALLAATLLALAACGDPDTNDPRGYTKAPLENPGWIVDGEESGAMAELGQPIRVPAMDTTALDTAAAAPPAQQQAAPQQPAAPR